MGSIADLLGDQLRAGLAQLIDPGVFDTTPALSENVVETAQDRTHEAMMEAVLDEVDPDPADARGEFVLRDDLDMDDVSFYAVVTYVGREAEVVLNDSQIEQQVMLVDLLDAVSDATSNHQRKILPVELQRRLQRP